MFLLLNSCGIVKFRTKRLVTKENKYIPPEFGENNSVLLVQLLDAKDPFERNFNKNTIRHFNKNIKRQVKKEYHGEYIFIQEYELTTSYYKKYQDKEMYRYVLLSRWDFYSGSGSAKSVVTVTCSILDRKDNVFYKSPDTTSYYNKLFQAYMINLEKERLKYIE